MLPVPHNGISGTFGLHVPFIAVPEDDETCAAVLARSPYPVVLMVSNRFGKTLSRSEKVYRRRFTVVVREDRGPALLRRERAIKVADLPRHLLPTEHIREKLRQSPFRLMFELLLFHTQPLLPGQQSRNREHGNHRRP